MAQPYQAVLLIAFGGPTSPEEIRPFLARVTKGIPIPPQRLEEVVHHYEAVGGKSPLNEITFRQAKALQKVLNESGHALPVYVGMRNSQPFFSDTLKKMFDDGIREPRWDLFFRPIEPKQAGNAIKIMSLRRVPRLASGPRRSITALVGTITLA